MEFTFPYDLICPKNDIQTVNRGRIHTTTRYKRGIKALQVLAWKQLGGRCDPTDLPVAVELRVWVPDLRRRDTHNLHIQIFDALEDFCYTDDELIHDTRIRRMGLDRENPRVEVTVEPIPDVCGE